MPKEVFESPRFRNVVPHLLVFIFFTGLLAPLGNARAQTNFTEELRTAAAVRSLTVAEAQKHHPVRLQGVVTFYDENFYSRFIQDDTAGIYLSSSGVPPIHLIPGQLVEVTGTTEAGEFAPIVTPQNIRVVGTQPLPVAKPVTDEQLASGVEDSQFVQITGVVRSVEQLQDISHLNMVKMATASGILIVYATQLPVANPEDIVDHTLRVQGVCSSKFNRRRQLFDVRIMAPRSQDLVVLQPAPEAPSAMATRPVGSLLQFNPQVSYGHRVKIAGTVTYFEPGRLLILQSGDQGVEVQTHGTEPLGLGDDVEALGFVSHGDYTPVLQDAVYHRISAGKAIVPVVVNPDIILRGTNDCELVKIDAILLDRDVRGTEKYLVLQENGFIFHAYLNQLEDHDAFAHLENRSRVSVTGVCRIDPGEWLAGEDWRAKAFRIQLRSINDVRVLESPSWWTLPRVLEISAAIGIVALIAFGWVVVLRRQVADRTRQLEAQNKKRERAERQHLIEQERTRVAQDLHDELGATLTEVSMLGTLARTPSLPLPDRDRYLEKLTATSRAVVSTLDEIVWAINPKYDTVESLASYYSLFAQRFLNLAGISCRLQTAESFPSAPLDSRLRHNAFLAFKEALNNAVRHSGASQILIDLEVVDEKLKVAIIDNGRGFVLTEGQPGCDGIAGMKQRMAKLRGRCDIKSIQGAGTTVEFWLPLEEGLS
ncbi:MAG TPA: ATP-binding protein [Verrucomicrobiae bacterium]|jgi:signal transduction histidine kinase|nr:ATP-binding protein [Verrucomicrobiae bacterium]